MELPSVFQNKNINITTNDQEYFYGNKKNITNNENNKINKYDLEAKINKLFNSNKYVYKIKVEILTKDGVINETIIGKTYNSLITYDNNLIPFNEILDINIK